MLELDIQFFSDDLPLPPTEEETSIVVGSAEVLYTKNYTGNEVSSVKAEIRVPVTEGETSGYVTLGSVEGWTLSSNGTVLSKQYESNQTDVVEVPLVGFNGTIFEEVTQQVVVEIYDIDGSEHIRVSVSYTREEEAGTNKLVSATVTAYIKDSYIGSYEFSETNTGWTLSDDKTMMTKDLEVNGAFINTCGIYTAGGEDTPETRISEEISYSVENVGLTLGRENIITTNIYSGGEVIGQKITITVPYTIDEKTGNATLREVEGWFLANNNTTLEKTFFENGKETINIYVEEANGYTFNALVQTIEFMNENLLTYKKIVKGRCDMTMCFYDVYTRAEIDNFKLQLEQQLDEIREKIGG